MVRCDSTAHIVKDNESGEKAFVVFGQLQQGDDEYLVAATPSIIMYSIEDGLMTLSVSNPDLALYSGPSDEVFDGNGKRIERSVYGRSWIDSPCGPTEVGVTLKGRWSISCSGDTEVTVRYEGENTVLAFSTREARTEEISLKQEKL